MKNEKDMNVLVNGLPGQMATVVARRIVTVGKHMLVPYSFRGERAGAVRVNGLPVQVLPASNREESIEIICAGYDPLMAVDFTIPEAVEGNVEFYCRRGIPFVMGTTGGDREALEEKVRGSDIVAVIASNMASPVVAFQAMMEYAAREFPGVLEGYRLSVVESHQEEKKDTSGTAKAVVRSFNGLGIPFTEEQIGKVRTKARQLGMGVPEQALGGHGWHKYRAISPQGDVVLEFSHNITGREVYVEGTMKALDFLQKKVEAGEKGKVYSMIDVLRG